MAIFFLSAVARQRCVAPVATGLLLLAGLRAPAADCNQNAVEDTEDIATGASPDCNGNSIPDECEFTPTELGPGPSAPTLGFFAEFVFATELNGDAANDLVAAGRLRDETVIASFLGNPARTLVAEPVHRVNLSFNSLVSTDFDGDGEGDLIGLTSSDIVVLEHLESGGFAAPRRFPAPSFTNQLATGDLDGNGRPDVVTTNRLRHHVAVHLQQDDGSLSPEPQTFPVGGRSPVQVVIEDMNDDSAQDIVTLNAQTRTVSVLRNLGDATFAEAVSFPVGEGRVTGLEIADPAGRGTPSVFVRLEDRLMSFSTATDDFGTPRQFDALPLDLAFVDHEGDGDLDLFVIDAEADVEGSIPQGRIAPFTHIETGAFVRGADILVEARLLVGGDWDGDGAKDLAVVSDGPHRVELLFSGEPPRIQFEAVTSHESEMRPHQMAFGDFNSDGLPDLAVANSNLLSHYTIAFNAGGGTFDPLVNVPYEGTTRSIATGDLDGDGTIDVLIGDITNTPKAGGSQLAVGFNRGSGEFAPAVKYGVWPALPHNVDLADLDADGDLDALAASVQGSVITMKNDGNGVFSGLTDVPVGVGPYWGTTADFDADGAIDYAITDRPGLAAFVLRNGGDGTFPSIERYPLPASPRGLLHTDVDRDGDEDLVVASGGLAAVLRNDGVGLFESPRSYDVGRELYFVMALDFDSDGTEDLAFTSDAADSVSVLLGRGGGEYAAPFHFPSGEGGRPGLTADVDLDGDVDLVVGNRPVNLITSFLNPAANRTLPGADYLEAICTPRDFQQLSVASRTAPIRRGLKFLTPARNAPELLPTVYQHTERFRLHQDFLAAVFPEQFPSLSAAEYADLVNRRSTRDYYAGVISLLQTPVGPSFGFSVLVDSSDIGEFLTQDEVGAVYRNLRETFTLEPLGYFPQSQLERELASAWVGAEFPIITAAGPSGGFQPYTRGVAFGRVRLLDREAFDDLNDRGQFSFQDILILDHAPRDIEAVVAGLITADTQTENSHTFIRLAIRNTPNAFIADAHEAFAEYDGALVRFEVTAEDFAIRPAELEEAQAFWDEQRPSLRRPPTSDPLYDGLPDFGEIAALEVEGNPPLVARFGGKASNMARLQTILSTPEFAEYRESGFAIPVRYYHEFMRSNRMPSAVDPARTVSYEGYLEELFDDARFQSDSEFRFDALDDLRDHIRDDGIVDSDLISRITVRIGEVLGTPDTTRVRFRSSSNIEDDVQFNGAGLYDSTSGCAADDLDEDEEGPSRCDATREGERTVARALKRVWRSLWNFKAYEERAFFGIDQRLAAMAVLVNRTFIDEASNGVAFTGNVTNPQDRRYVITAQLGEESVVSPEPGVRAEKNLLTIVDGEVGDITRASLSTLVEPGRFVVTDEQLRELGRLMAHIDDNFPVELDDFDRNQVLLDMEFKFLPSGELAVKQVRPFLLNTPPLPTPEFTLEVPADTEVCGSYIPFRGAAEAYAAKSTLRFTSGVFTLATDSESQEVPLIEALRVGPAQELATAERPGVFRVERVAAGEGVTSYVFAFSQPYSLQDETPIVINARLVFRASGEEPLDGGRLVLDDAYFTTPPGDEGFGALLGGTSAIRYGSCEYGTLRTFRLDAAFADGTRLELTEQLGDEEARSLFAAPATLTRARVTANDGTTHQVSSYWQLVYAAENHNDPVDYWAVLDEPQAFPDTPGPVFALAFEAPPVFREAPGGRAGELLYLAPDLSVIARSALVEFTRGTHREALFRRGDVQGDGAFDLADPVFLLEWLFRDGAAPPCRRAADVNADDRINVVDAITALGQLLRGAPIPEPAGACGSAESALGCERSPGCEGG